MLLSLFASSSLWVLSAAPAGMPDALGAGGRTSETVASDDEAAASWIRQNAIPFKTASAGSGLEDLEPLGAIIGDARIVGLGEPTHGTREAFQFKHRLLEYLVEKKGFRIFSIEANMPESYALNAYVQGGDGDPRKLIAGMYFWTWNTEEVFQMVEWMRGWNARNPGSTPLQFTGFDMQTDTVAASIATEYVKTHLPNLTGRATAAFEKAARLDFGSGGGESEMASATGLFPVEDAKGKKLTLSAWIRTENATGWAGVWWRCDTPAGVGGFENMEEKRITGTTGWTRYEFTLDVNPDTTNINFGFMLIGQGTAWFDDLEITLDGKKYENPEKFSFDFENDAVRYLSGGGNGYKVARVEVEPRSGMKCLEIRKDAAPAVKPEEVMPELEAVIAEMDSHASALSTAQAAKDARWAVQNARVVHQRARMLAEGMQGGSSMRDRCMAENVEWILKENPGQKIVLWAHNAHVSKGELWGQRWMGSHLEQKFPGEQLVIGFATGTGIYSAFTGFGTGEQKLSRENALQAPPEGSVERVLASAGIPNFLLDIRRSAESDPGTAWAAGSRTIRSIGAAAMDAQFFPCVASQLFDVLVWQAETTASRAIPPAGSGAPATP
jgi:erythromycin esterase-like protein